MKLGLMGATPEEILCLTDYIKDQKRTTIAQREYITGILFGTPVVLVLSRWGKVAAASTATTLIQEFKVTSLMMTGLAGALNSNLKVGDVLIAESLYQHDLDSRPFFEEFEIPYLHQIRIETDKALSQLALSATQKFLEEHSPENKSHSGIIVSVDQFIGNTELRQTLTEKCPDALATEMEGAAVAQVCFEHNIPFTILRIISDGANVDASFDFSTFIKKKTPFYTLEIMRELLSRMA